MALPRHLIDKSSQRFGFSPVDQSLFLSIQCRGSGCFRVGGEVRSRDIARLGRSVLSNMIPGTLGQIWISATVTSCVC